MTESQTLTPEIKSHDENQSEKQEISQDQPEVEVDQTAEKELAACLKVHDSGSDSDVSVVSTRSKSKFIPKTLKTRADLIKKIKQTSEHLGNQIEVKSMRLHRRRRNSLQDILKEQVARVVQTQAEKQLGIPQEHDKRLEYAVSCLYKFDICVMKIAERVVDYCNFGMTIDGLAKTIDSDKDIKCEMKEALKDFIEEGEYDWVKEAASPTTRLLLCHLYPLMSVLRRSEEIQKTKEIFPGMMPGLATAKIRSVIRPPRQNSEPTVAVPRSHPPRPKLPSTLRVV
jgi:hypothetical protein